MAITGPPEREGERDVYIHIIYICMFLTITGCIGVYKGIQEYGDIAPNMENQMKKTMENQSTIPNHETKSAKEHLELTVLPAGRSLPTTCSTTKNSQHTHHTNVTRRAGGDAFIKIRVYGSAKVRQKCTGNS